MNKEQLNALKTAKALLDEALNKKAGLHIPTRINIGETYDTPAAKITVTNITISGFHLSRPSIGVEYDYALNSGQTGHEYNSLGNFKRLWEK